eukprot:1428010-Pleurochrysis_carterae.AAC.1
MVVQICLLLLSKDPAVAQSFPFVDMLAAYTVLSSLYHSQRVPAPVPGSNAPKLVADVETRKGRGRGPAGRRAPGLLEAFSFCRQSSI